MPKNPPIEIPLGEGPDEKTAALLRQPGVLTYAYNADMRQVGVLRKRRGFEAVDLGAGVNFDDVENMYLNVETYRGELVIVGRDFLYALASLGGNLTGEDANATVVRRGPVIRGGGAVEHVYSSSLGSEL